jgi:hypothetical protein
MDGFDSISVSSVFSSSSVNKTTSSETDISQKRATGHLLLQNLMQAIKGLMKEQQSNIAAATTPTSSSSEPPPTKRQKMEELPDIPDPQKIWIGQSDEVPKCEGEIMVQLTLAGLVNALAGHPGGLVDAKMVSPLPLDAIIPTAAITLGQLRQYALALHRAIQTKVEGDFLATTPHRIQNMLCAELSDSEFRSTRKRVYETVIEGKGRNVGGEDGDDTPVAARVSEHDAERGTFADLAMYQIQIC